MNQLYPLKFKPILKDKIWGGKKLRELLNKKDASDKCGESWEISGVEGDFSVIENGFLAGNNLSEILEIYMDELVGEKTYDKFGNEFPLLIKFIDANDNLSIQVHPDDELAEKRHNSFGKTEMWYIMEAENGAELIVGFNKQVDKELYLSHLNKDTLAEILNCEIISKGDVFFMPAGRVHAIGAGSVVAEIQQTSDVTYRIYDFNRKDDKGNLRELHTELALDAIDFDFYPEYKTKYELKPNETAEIVQCEYFKTNLLEIDKGLERDFTPFDTFVIYMCLEGSATIKYNGGEETVEMGQTILVPATLNEFQVVPTPKAKLLEVYLPGNK